MDLNICLHCPIVNDGEFETVLRPLGYFSHFIMELKERKVLFINIERNRCFLVCLVCLDFGMSVLGSFVSSINRSLGFC